MTENTSPRISIIVPVYKVEQYLRRCLDSIAAQTFTDWECILIDDGSPDGSGAICNEYAGRDARFRVIHQENKGVSAARNAGLDAAKGEWIGFVDSDDWIEAEMYELLFAAAHENDDVVYCDIFHEYRNKTVAVHYEPACQDSVQNVKKLLCGKITGYLVCKLIKRNLIGTVRFDTSSLLCEDLLFCLQIFLRAKGVSCIASPLSHYRLTNVQSATHSLWFSEQKISSLLGVCESVKKILENNSLLTECRDEIEMFIADKKGWFLLNADLSCAKKYGHCFDEINLLLKKLKTDSLYTHVILWLFASGFLYLPHFLVAARKTIRLCGTKFRGTLCK